MSKSTKRTAPTKKKRKKTVVAVSGGFDPIHIGHVRYLTEAKKLGDELVVILNNDNWLKKKKGFVFMPESERIEVLMGIKAVDRVVVTGHTKNDTDKSVSKELKLVHPDIFANGGDRKPDGDPVPEVAVCEKLGIKMLYNVGDGGKVQSSSWLTNNMTGNGILDVRPWGYMHTYKKDTHFWIKTINVSPGRRLSLQKHHHRDEFWVCIEGTVTAEIGKKKKTLRPGDFVHFKQGVKHRLSSKTGGAIVEVAHGPNVHEEDIIRFADDFGRAG